MAGVDIKTGQLERAGWVRGGIVVSFADSLDAIVAAASEGGDTGHDLAGFKRQTGRYGYRFVARCRRCSHEIVVGRAAAGWSFSPPPRMCAGDPRHAGATVG